MALPESYGSRLPLIGSRIIAFESRNPGSIRMRINPDLQKIAAASKDLQDLGFKKPLFRSPQQFIFDCVLSYQNAIEMWLPFAELHRLMSDRVQIWFGFGAYCGWQGPLKAVDFDAERGKRMLLLIDIGPVFTEISDLLDPIKSKSELSQNS
jgi:hypothetical protein